MNQPVHSVYLESFFIDRYEVTAGQFRSCVDAGECLAAVILDSDGNVLEDCNWGNPEHEEHPINCASWHQATQYCGWVGLRLPTEAEWEKAARSEDERTFPWGEEYGCNRGNFDDDTTRTFADGVYDPEAEVAAHRELTGASVRGSYLMLGNRYALTLLGRSAARLSTITEEAVVPWVWHLTSGVGYCDAPLPHPWKIASKPGVLDRWFTAQEILSEFSHWRQVAAEVIDWLWAQRKPDGTWDLGGRPARSEFLPLSNDWRQRRARVQDWTTRVLLLLQRYHGSGS